MHWRGVTNPSSISPSDLSRLSKSRLFVSRLERANTHWWQLHMCLRPLQPTDKQTCPSLGWRVLTHDMNVQHLRMRTMTLKPPALSDEKQVIRHSGLEASEVQCTCMKVTHG